MRFEGTLTTWNDDRGFGHIQPTQGGEPVFVHISAWPKGAGRPQLKQAVSFELEQGPKGQRARKVALLQTRQAARPTPRPGQPQGRRPGRARPTPWNVATWLALPAFLVVYALVDLLWRPPLWVAAWYGVASVLAFIAYAIDKSAAVGSGWRTAESSLHLLGLLGGWPGALVAQRMFRHKTSKAEFRVVFWATVVVNVVGFVVWASPWGEWVLGVL